MSAVGRTATGRNEMSQPTSDVTPEFLQAFADAWNRHDVDALMSFMTDDCVFDASAGADVCGTRYVGREAVRVGYAEVWSVFPDAAWSNARHLIHGDRVRMDIHGNKG